MRDFSAHPDALVRLYGRDPEKFRDLIRNDASADDVVALAHRKTVVERFRALLTDDAAFESARAESGGDREKVWQRFLETNPVLGVSLAGQLLRSWDDSMLEQVVAGFSVAGPGKRTDALLRTSGRIRSLVFAEIKHHETALLGRREYRPDVGRRRRTLWAESLRSSRPWTGRFGLLEIASPTSTMKVPRPARPRG